MRIARPAVIASCAALVLSVCTGCTSTRVKRVARFEPADGPALVQRQAPESAAYKVKFADGSGDELRTLGGSKRIVRRGDLLGFTTSAEGTVIAIAGEEQFPLNKLPPSARYCVWVSREERQTQFARELNKAATTAAVGTLVTVIVAGAVSMELWDQQLDDDCDEAEDDEDDNDHPWLDAAGHLIREVIPSGKGSSGKTRNTRQTR